jgi:hypothetical protein
MWFAKSRWPGTQSIAPRSSEIQLIGQLHDEGLNALRIGLTRRLSGCPDVVNAYLARVRYARDDTPRVAIFVEAPGVSRERECEIADLCAGVLNMDVILADGLPESVGETLRAGYTPLYVPGMNLFECEFIVGQDDIAALPRRCQGAIVTYYVAASTYQDAIRVAVERLHDEGYELRGLVDNKVRQLAPHSWQPAAEPDDSSHCDDHPTKDDILAVAATGGYLKGPTYAWLHDAGELGADS